MNKRFSDDLLTERKGKGMREKGKGAKCDFFSVFPFPFSLNLTQQLQHVFAINGAADFAEAGDLRKGFCRIRASVCNIPHRLTRHHNIRGDIALTRANFTLSLIHI